MTKLHPALIAKILLFAVLTLFLTNCGDDTEEPQNISLDVSALEQNLTSALTKAAVDGLGTLLPANIASLIVGNTDSIATVLALIGDGSVSDISFENVKNQLGDLITADNISTATNLIFGEGSSITLAIDGATSLITTATGTYNAVSGLLDFVGSF